MHMRHHMHMLNRRVQILLDKERYDKVARLARRRGVPAAAVIREAIDQLTDELEWQVRRQAIEAILAAPPTDVPEDPADLRRELDEARARFKE